MKSFHALRHALVILAILLWGSSLPAITLGHENKEELPIMDFAAKALAASRGGPDGGGYTFFDSNDPEGPLFSWVDISESGRDLELSDDSSSDLFSIGFSFAFYGDEYTEINVASNGVVYFGTNTYLGLSNLCLPAESGYGTDTNTLIAAFWDDLVPETGPGESGKVFAEILGEAPERRLVIMWKDVPRFGFPDPFSFELILSESDSSILMQYLEVGETTGASATVGIEDLGTSSSYGLEYMCNSATLSANLAVLFQPRQAPPEAIPVLDGPGILVFVFLLGFIGWMRIRSSVTGF